MPKCCFANARLLLRSRRFCLIFPKNVWYVCRIKLIGSVAETFDPGPSNDWANLFIRHFGATTLLLNRSSCQMNDYFCGDFCQQHKVKHFKSDEVGLKDSDEKVWATDWNVKIEDFHHINIARETRERVAQILWKSDKICTSRPRHNHFSSPPN